MNIIKSVGYSDTEILKSILALYVPSGVFDLDPTYSKGNFYKEIPKPNYCSDLNPQDELTLNGDATNLHWIKDNNISSIVFDPPFMFGTHGQTKNNIMNKRFTMFNNFGELETMYKKSLKEFYRILVVGGYLFFKCQDYTDSKTTMTHCLILEWALEQKFYAQDLFILISQRRIYNPKLKQIHARKFHSYWWIFRK